MSWRSETRICDEVLRDQDLISERALGRFEGMMVGMIVMCAFLALAMLWAAW